MKVSSLAPRTGASKKTLKPKPIGRRFLSIRSRHPSIDGLRGVILLPKKAVYRHGSISTHESPYEINSIQCVKTSASKLLMKEAFDKGGVKHLPWFPLNKAKLEGNNLTDGKTSLKFPVVVKSFYGSRGNGNFKLDSPKEFETWVAGKTRANYLVEQYYPGSVEFRIHITAHGPVYSLRKMLRDDVPKEKRWVRNDSTCVWITEYTQSKTPGGQFLSFTGIESPTFDKPGNWNEIIQECKKALSAVGGDILAVDVKAQSNNGQKGRRGKVDFYILEVNSAPSMGQITTYIYKKELPRILQNKYGDFKTT